MTWFLLLSAATVFVVAIMALLAMKDGKPPEARAAPPWKIALVILAAAAICSPLGYCVYGIAHAMNEVERAGAGTSTAAPDADALARDMAEASRPAFDVSMAQAMERMAGAGGPAVAAWRPAEVTAQGQIWRRADGGWAIRAAPNGRLQQLSVTVSGDGDHLNKILAPEYLRMMVATVAPDAPAEDRARLDRNLFEALGREHGIIFFDDGHTMRPIGVRTFGHSWELTLARDLEPGS